jgi:hypothetical protein
MSDSKQDALFAVRVVDLFHSDNFFFVEDLDRVES